MMWLSLFGGFVKKYWLPILLFGVISFVGVKYHRMSMTIAGLDQQNREQLLQISTLHKQREMLIGELQSQNAAISALAQQKEILDRKVYELNQRVPEKTVEIREKIKTVEKEVVSQDCITAISEAAKVIQGLKDASEH